MKCIKELGITRNDEWYTPSWLAARVRVCLGEIDYDPASCEAANKIVGATRYATIADEVDRPIPYDVVSIYCNPPYSKAKHFIRKIYNHLESKMYLESNSAVLACLLINTVSINTRYMHQLLSLPNIMCILHDRVRFVNADGVYGPNPLFGQTVFFVGFHGLKTAASKVQDMFGGISTIYKTW